VFQPILALDDRTCHGFEALVRWRHPVRGEIGASLLIDVAQEARLIVPARQPHRARSLPALERMARSRPVARCALRARQHLADEAATRAPTPRSPTRWRCGRSLANAGDRNDRNGLDRFDGHGRSLYGQLADDGLRVCLDDFGTGYHHYATSTIPNRRDQDRSLVRRLGRQRSGEIPIVAGIIALARGLNAEVIAEGIETIEQRELISDLGCRLVQGYLFARPMSADDAFRFAQRTIAPAEKIS